MIYAELPSERRGIREDAPVDLPLLMSDNAAAAWLGVSRTTFRRRVDDGTFPQPIRIAGATRWRRDELFAAVQQIAEAAAARPPRRRRA